MNTYRWVWDFLWPYISKRVIPESSWVNVDTLASSPAHTLSAFNTVRLILPCSCTIHGVRNYSVFKELTTPSVRKEGSSIDDSQLYADRRKLAYIDHLITVISDENIYFAKSTNCMEFPVSSSSEYTLHSSRSNSSIHYSLKLFIRDV